MTDLNIRIEYRTGWLDPITLNLNGDPFDGLGHEDIAEIVWQGVESPHREEGRVGIIQNVLGVLRHDGVKVGGLTVGDRIVVGDVSLTVDSVGWVLTENYVHPEWRN